MKGETMPSKRDIVYILKPDCSGDELRYSLRSICKNLPHRYVWFVGGQPAGFIPDRRIIHTQTGESKWHKIRSSMYRAIENEELSDEFFLFNDDFFVMKPVKGKFVNFANGTLTELIEKLRPLNPWLTPYARTVAKAREELKSMKYGEANFEVHMPMLIKKALVRGSVPLCSSPQMRSVYGNINKVDYVEHKDVKVYDYNAVPEDPDFLSTNDEMFATGKVGEYIRSQFPEPCRYEDEYGEIKEHIEMAEDQEAGLGS